MGFLNKVKDAAVNTGIKLAVSQLNEGKMEKYGHIDSMTVDTAHKKMTVTVSLKGESDPVTVNVGEYIFDDDCLTIKEVSTSREWATRIFADLFPEGKKIDLDSRLAAILEKVL